MKKSKKSQRGAGLIMAMLTLFLLSLLGGALLSATTVDVWIADNHRKAIQLLYLTEAGIEDGREFLRTAMPAPSAAPFLEDKPLRDASGREMGRYSVYLTRSDPPVLKSVGVIGDARKTIEVLLAKSGFPSLSEAITLNGDILIEDGLDARLTSPEATERIVEGIIANATEVYDPAGDGVFALGPIGAPDDYRVAVVNGDCRFGDATGYGLLLVRGELALYGTLEWNGLILAIGQGVMRSDDATTGRITGGVLVTRTRAADRGPGNPLGTLLAARGAIEFDLGGEPIVVEYSPEEMDRANARFPYVPFSYREY